MIDYKVVIPSYQRENMIQEKTLLLLEKYSISPEKVYVFTANEQEQENYVKALKNNKYNQNIIQGVPTLRDQRNFVEQEYFKEGDYIVYMDDDIDSIKKKVGENKLAEIDNFEDELIFKGYEHMLEHNAFIWGLYAASNPFFMKDRINTNLCYIIGALFAVRIQKDDFLKRITNHGEDYEYSIRQYIKNKSVVRFDTYTPITKYFSTGGLQEVRNDKYIYDSIRLIEKTFPNYCSLYFRKTGRAELKLKEKK